MKENQKDIIENYISSYNNFDIKGMVRDLDEDIIFENISDDEVTFITEGIKKFKQQAESAKRSFRERKQTIESWHFDEDIVSVKIDYKGVLAADLPNGGKAGVTLELKGTSVFEIKDGKVMRITDKS